jgi:hypothetical protein
VEPIPRPTLLAVIVAKAAERGLTPSGIKRSQRAALRGVEQFEEGRLSSLARTVDDHDAERLGELTQPVTRGSRNKLLHTNPAIACPSDDCN